MEAIVTICPEFFLSIVGKKALTVQWWEVALTFIVFSILSSVFSNIFLPETIPMIYSK